MSITSSYTKNMQRGIFSPIVAIIILIVLGILIYQFRQKTDEVVTILKASASPAVTIKPLVTQAPSSSPSSSTPSASVRDIIVKPVELPISFEVSCAKDHDFLGNHLDLMMAIGNLESLGSKDFLITTKDIKDNRYAGTTVKSSEASNQTWRLHKYIPANQAPYQPLEMIPDGRVYEVAIYKAQYGNDGSIELYIEVGKTTFSKKCETYN